MSSSGYRVVYRFRAIRTGSIKGVFWWCACKDVSGNNGTSYGWGTGGIARFYVQGNDAAGSGVANTPDGTTIGGANNFSDFIHPKTPTSAELTLHKTTQGGAASTTSGTGQNSQPYMEFPTPVPVVKDGIYHVVVRNADPDPANNWFNPDHIGSPPTGFPITPAQPDVDWSLLTSTTSGSTWSVPQVGGGPREYIPNLRILYTDGFTYGCGNLDAYNNADDSVTATKWQRDTYYAPQAMTLTHLNSMGYNISGTGDLVATIQNSAGATLGTVTFTGLTSVDRAWAGRKQISPGPISVTGGQLIRIVFRATSGEIGMRSSGREECADGHWDASGFSTNQAMNWYQPGFLNGVNTGWQQVSTNSGSSWANLGGADFYKICMYFSVVVP